MDELATQTNCNEATQTGSNSGPGSLLVILSELPNDEQPIQKKGQEATQTYGRASNSDKWTSKQLRQIEQLRQVDKQAAQTNGRASNSNKWTMELT